MSVYQTGSVRVIVNSPSVLGYNTEFTTYVTAGDLFRVRETGEYPFYEIAAVTSATRLSLTASYQNSEYTASTALNGMPYQIVTDFTPHYSLPELSANDINFQVAYTKSMRLIDSALYQLSASSITVNLASAVVENMTVNTLEYSSDVLASNLNYTGQVATSLAGTTLSFGDVCYYKSDGKFWKASADTETTSKGMIRMAVATINADASGLFLKEGTIRKDGWGFTAIGSPVFLATPVGELTQTPPSSTGQIVRLMGWPKNASTLEFEPSTVYFEME